MSFFNSNITGAGGSGGAAGGLVTKFEKSITIGSEATAEIVINLADDISNYKNITNEQIIVELQKISVSLDSGTSGYANLEHSYNQETGDLTITSSTSLMPFRNPSELTLPIAIYVAGAVQLPPAPESTVNLVNMFAFENRTMMDTEYLSQFLDEPSINGGSITGTAKKKMVGKYMYGFAQNDGGATFSVNGVPYTSTTIHLAEIKVGDVLLVHGKKATTSQSNAGRVYVVLEVLE